MDKAARLKNGITTSEDIRLLVDTFYTRASQDHLLGSIFTTRFDGKSAPLEPLYLYWESVLLGNNTYSDVPFPKHADLPLTHQHFNRWLSLFLETVDDLFEGPTATEAKARAIKMSEVFRFKMELINF